MIYSKDITMPEILVNRFMNALEFLDNVEEYPAFIKESTKYVEEDVRFVASAKLTNKLLQQYYLQFHFTEQ